MKNAVLLFMFSMTTGPNAWGLQLGNPKPMDEVLMTSAALNSTVLKQALSNPNLAGFKSAILNEYEGRKIVTLEFETRSQKVCIIDIEMESRFRAGLSLYTPPQFSVVGIVDQIGCE